MDGSGVGWLVGEGWENEGEKWGSEEREGFEGEGVTIADLVQTSGEEDWGDEHEETTSEGMIVGDLCLVLLLVSEFCNDLYH